MCRARVSHLREWGVACLATRQQYGVVGGGGSDDYTRLLTLQPAGTLHVATALPTPHYAYDAYIRACEAFIMSHWPTGERGRQ